MTIDTPIANLRPLRLVEILDQGFRLYRRNFLKFTAIVAAPMIPTMLLVLAPMVLFAPFLLQDQLDEWGFQIPASLSFFSFLTGTGLTILTSAIGGTVLQSLAPAAIARAVTDVYFGGAASIAGTYRKLKPHLLRLFGAVGLLLAVILGVSLASSALSSIVPCIPLLLMPVQYGVMIFIQGLILPLVPTVVMLERQGVWSAIRRAWELARRRFWHMFGFMAILYVLNLAIATGPFLLILIGLQFVTTPLTEILNAGSLPILAAAITMLATMLLQLFYMSFQWTSITLMYFDLRVRSEGLDLALQANATETIDPNEVLAQAPPVEKTSLITWKEVGYLAIICIGMFALYLIPMILAIGIAILLLPIS